MHEDPEVAGGRETPAPVPIRRRDTGPQPPPPELGEAQVRLVQNLRGIRICLVLLLMLAVVHMLYFARAILLPMAMAVLMSLVLKPVRKRLTNAGLPSFASAVIVFSAFTVVLLVGARLLWEPANHWLEQAPESLRNVREQLSGVEGPLGVIQEAGQELAELTAMSEKDGAVKPPVSVRVEQPALTSQLLNTTGGFVTSLGITLSLLFFLLASGDRFLEKLVQIKKSWREKWDTVLLVKEIEHKISTYLGTITLINFGLGVVIALGLWLVGMPHPLLWGGLAALLNYIPFAGLIIGSCVVFVVAASEFSTLGHALLAPAVYLIANGVEANLVTPVMLHKSVSLNPVVILVAIFLGGWCWGVGGIFLAVPCLLVAKIICESHEPLEQIAVFLGR